jgi:hypothetical protein
MSFYGIEDDDKVNKKSHIRQLVDILAVDIAGKETNNTTTNTKKKYEVFVTGSDSSVVKSGLFQTIFDQDNTLQTSNEMLDLTIGTFAKYNPATTTPVAAANYTINFANQGVNNDVVITPITASVDASNKPIFSSDTLMMREKINLYKQYAQILLGDSSKYFTAPYDDDVSNDDETRIDHALFINIKRLFTRDSIDKEKFSMKIGLNAGSDASESSLQDGVSSVLKLLSDSGAKSSLTVTPSGASVGTIVDDSNSAVGLIFYENGIVILNAEKVFNASQTLIGTISYVAGSSGTATINAGSGIRFIPDVWVSGSVDNVLDHITETRFGRASSSAIGLINKTTINSTIYFCRIPPKEANFSTNPTYTDSSGSLRCIEEKGDDPFAYVTTVGLYDGASRLLAVAKTSRPIEKNPEVDLSISVRIDY